MVTDALFGISMLFRVPIVGYMALFFSMFFSCTLAVKSFKAGLGGWSVLRALTGYELFFRANKALRATGVITTGAEWGALMEFWIEESFVEGYPLLFLSTVMFLMYAFSKVRHVISAGMMPELASWTLNQNPLCRAS